MKKTIILLLFVGFAACEQAAESLLIPENKLLLMLEDVHVAEAALTGLAPERKDSIARIYYDQIYTIYGVTEAEFNHDLELLKSRPEELAKVYKKLADKTE